jgi:NAD(P)H-hydrate epimerase
MGWHPCCLRPALPVGQTSDTIAGMNTPITVSRDAIREIDRVAIEEYGIPGVVLMENAGRGTADVALDWLGSPADQRAVILAGPGNNGGDGYVIARHLHNAGVHTTTVLCCDPAKLKGDALTNYTIVRNMRLDVRRFESTAELDGVADLIRRADLTVDALLGTGFTGQVRSPMAELVQRVNELRPLKVLAVDLPSGLDADTGQASNACIRAHKTCTFVAQKQGFPQAKELTGEVIVVDIGVPRELRPGA